MTHSSIMTRFLTDDSGAVTVDWTVLASAAVGLAIATTAIMTDTIEVLAGRMDGELRARQLSDDWVQFFAAHFTPVLESGYLSEAQAELLYDAANELMNYDVIDAVTAGVTALEEGTITPEELVELIAVASVAYQRNLMDDGMLDYYFGFETGNPYYMTIANPPTSTM